VAKDVPLQKCIEAIQARGIKFMVVRVLTEKSAYSGKVEAPAYIAFAARKFLGRLGDWLNANKPGVKLVLETNHEWMTKYAANMLNWAFEYPSMVEQKAVLPLVNSLPDASEKVKYFISTRPTCEFWHYFDGPAVDLVLFYGGERAKWLEWIGAPAADTTPPTVPAGLVGSAGGGGTVILSWQPSTDNIGVAGYQVYRDGAEALAVTGTSASFSNVPTGTYTYGVAAFDAAGNESAPAQISVVVKPVETPVTRAEFDALVNRVVELESHAHPRVHTHVTGGPV